MASPAKKPKTEGKTKQFFQKQARKAQNSLEIGDKGFLVTCNFKEREALREVYKLLNDYSDQVVGDTEEVVKPQEDEDEDITSQLQEQINKTKQETKQKATKFLSISTGVQNLLFIRTKDAEPLELGDKIFSDIFDNKIKKSKFILRMLPIATVCQAKIEDIKAAGGELFDQHFLKSPSTFAITFNKRYNNDTNREEVINELAGLVALKNSGNKVDLKEPQKSIIVEILKGFCLLTVVSNFHKYKKYNLSELNKTFSGQDEPEPTDAAEVEDNVTEPAADVKTNESLKKTFIS